jgi:hypothetical protein
VHGGAPVDKNLVVGVAHKVEKSHFIKDFIFIEVLCTPKLYLGSAPAHNKSSFMVPSNKYQPSIFVHPKAKKISYYSPNRDKYDTYRG